MVTKCQALLLKTYGLQVPEVVEQAGNHDPDDISESILRQYHPAVTYNKVRNITFAIKFKYFQHFQKGNDISFQKRKYINFQKRYNRLNFQKK